MHTLLVFKCYSGSSVQHHCSLINSSEATTRAELAKQGLLIIKVTKLHVKFPFQNLIYI